MLITTANDLPGYEMTETLGEVFGLTVRSRNIGSQLGAGLKSILGGELKGMTKALADSRQQVIERMVEEAAAKGADAIVAMRFGTPLRWAAIGQRYARTGPPSAHARSDGPKIRVHFSCLRDHPTLTNARSGFGDSTKNAALRAFLPLPTPKPLIFRKLASPPCRSPSLTAQALH